MGKVIMNKEMEKELDRRFCESFLRGVYNFAAETPGPTAETKDSDGSGEGGEGSASNPESGVSFAPYTESLLKTKDASGNVAAPTPTFPTATGGGDAPKTTPKEGKNPSKPETTNPTTEKTVVNPQEFERKSVEYDKKRAEAKTDQEREELDKKYVDVRSAREAQNTTLNLVKRMAPGKNETWSQAWNRLTPEQKWGVGIGGGVSSLLALQMLTKKKKDLSDYLMAGVFPIAGVAAGAFGGSALTANPNTFDENVYREAYQRLTQPQTSTGTPA